MLDDGRITDSQGRTVDFKNTIIILTSNLGSDSLLTGIDDNGEITDEAKNAVQMTLRASFRPEFLNRLDETIMFKPLSKDNITHIVDLQLADLNRRLADKELSVELTNEALDFVVKRGYDPAFGARPLKRFLEKSVETLVARVILEGNVSPGQKITVDFDSSRDTLVAR